MIYLLRRRKLGRTSCREIAKNSQTGIQVYRNDARLPDYADYLFRWGCTSEAGAEVTVNIAKAIHVVDNKLAFRRLLQKEELCPFTWAEGEQKQGPFPCVVRPIYHHQGRAFFFCQNQWEFDAACDRLEARGKDWYASAFIDKVAEYRVFVVQGRCACVARKYPAPGGGHAWNVFQGGKFENVNWDRWPLKAVKVSIEAFNLSGLDFGGVDVMVDREGECYVLEINAAPSLTSPYRQQCMARAFDYIVRNGKEKIPLMAEKGGYLKFIHPAINQNARQ